MDINKYMTTVINFTMFVVVIILSSMLIESAFRLITHTMPEPYYAYGMRNDFVLSPYVMFAEPDVSHGGKLNSQGFEGPELQAFKNSIEIRIAVLGGSAAWGGGIKKSIAGNLQKFLKEYFPNKDIRVVNYGRRSYISMQELILLQRNILQLNFDLIIVYDGFNDIYVPYCYEKEGVGYPFLYSNLKERIDSTTLINYGIIINYLSSKSAIINYFKKSNHLNNYEYRFDINKCCKEYYNNIYQMAVLSKAYNANFIVTVQPCIATKKHLTSNEKCLIDNNTLKNLKIYYDNLIYNAKEAANKTRSNYIEVTNVFDDIRDDIFCDVVHNDIGKGNPLIAKKLADEINALNILKK